ncbi:MAG: hypothetical protein AAB966_05415, partial [Patescibacteria group bacterium]
MNFPPKQLLSQMVKNGAIPKESADAYELESIQKNIPIYDYLLAHSKLNKVDVLKAAAEVLQITFVDLTASPIDPQAAGLVSEAVAKRFNILPYRFDPA